MLRRGNLTSLERFARRGAVPAGHPAPGGRRPAPASRRILSRVPAPSLSAAPSLPAASSLPAAPSLPAASSLLAVLFRLALLFLFTPLAIGAPLAAQAGGASSADPNAAPTIDLTLDRAIEIALSDSHRIRYLRENLRWAEHNLWAARAGFRTYAQSSFYLPVYDEGTRLIDIPDGNPVAKDFRSLQIRGALDLIQPLPWIPWGGGELTFRSEAYQLNSWTPATYDPDVELRSNKFYTSLRMIVDKPLFTINNLTLGLRRALLAYDRQTRVFKRSELDLVYQVTQAFYQLYRSSQEVKINREQVERQAAIFQTTQDKFRAGLIAEVDAMQAEVEVIQSRNQLEQTEGAFQEREAGLKQLIGLPLEARVNLFDEIEPLALAVDPDRAVALALAQRSELAEREIDIAERKIAIDQVDARTSIKGNLRAYYDLSGYSDPDLAWGTSTADLFDSSWDQLARTPNRGVTFELQVPVWDWGKNDAEVEAERARLRQDQMELEDLRRNIQIEVRDVVRRTRETWSRVEMLRKSKEVSRRSFEINLQRFENGDITSTDLARASEQLSQSNLSYLAAFIEYKLALADLRRKTLYDFEAHRSLIEENP